MAEVLRGDLVYQDDIASDIERVFGEEFVSSNPNGHWSIRHDILQEFRRMSEDSVVWLEHDAAWRKREPGDKPGRRQP